MTKEEFLHYPQGIDKHPGLCTCGESWPCPVFISALETVVKKDKTFLDLKKKGDY